MEDLALRQTFEQAVSQHQGGQLPRAEALYRDVLAHVPDHVPALGMLATICHQTGRTAEAVDLLRHALALCPDRAELYYNYGKVLKDGGRLDEAIAAYRRALELKPDFPQALNNLGNALRSKGLVDDAVTTFGRAVALSPRSPEAQYNLGTALHESGHPDEAAAAYQRAIELRPIYVEAYNNLGTLLHQNGRLDEAMVVFRQALSVRPDNIDALNNLGSALRQTGEIDQAIAWLRQAELATHNPRIGSNLLYALHFHPAYDRRRIFSEHVRWRQTYADPLKPQIQPHLNQRIPGRKLRIGYCGTCLGNHPQGRLFLALAANHDREQFEIFCYDNRSANDHIAQKIRACTDASRQTIGMSDAQIAELVRRDKIDILVDLAMHTGDNRMMVFALKPAPVQVTYLAYCSTTGLDTIDYRITDPYLDPPDRDDAFYSERSVRLPHSYWCYSAPAEAPPVGPLPADATGAVTFGSLNDFMKVTPGQLTLWSQLLCQVPASRLILHAREGSHRSRVLDQFERLGVAPERVKFAGLMSLAEYFRLFNQIDIALDTFPYAGGTTTLDALWMGVPVVSMSGDTGVSRGGLSILANLGLPELVADDASGYVRIASELAANLPRLREFRSTMRQRMTTSPLMNAPAFARSFEEAYRRMWQAWCDAR